MSNLIADNDECAEFNGECQHNCTNTNGSYSCSCNNDYKLSKDEYNCTEYSWCEKLHLPCPLITEMACSFSLLLIIAGLGWKSIILLPSTVIHCSTYRCKCYYYCQVPNEAEESKGF